MLVADERCVTEHILVVFFGGVSLRKGSCFRRHIYHPSFLGLRWSFSFVLLCLRFAELYTSAIFLHLLRLLRALNIDGQVCEGAPFHLFLVVTLSAIQVRLLLLI